MGNDQGPKTLSFFAMDRDLTVRIYVNGSDVKDLKLAHGSSGYFQGAWGHGFAVMVTWGMLRQSVET